MTPAQLDAALEGYRAQLAQLHALSRERDQYCRAQLRRLDLIADVNARIAALRAVVRQERAALDAMLREVP